MPARQFHRDHDVGYHEGVLQELASCPFSVPRDAGGGDIRIVAKQPGPPLGKRIDHLMGATPVKIFDLRQGSIKIAAMKEELESPQHVLEASAYQCRYLGRTQKAVDAHASQDLHIARGDL